MKNWHAWEEDKKEKDRIDKKNCVRANETTANKLSYKKRNKF